LACLALVYGIHAPALAMPSSKVPAGFEDVVLGQIEQLEIRLLGRSLGVFAVKVTPSTVMIEQPEAVAEAIGFAEEDKDAVRTHVVRALSQSMPRNGNLVCAGSAPTTSCGYVETDNAAVIFDEGNGLLNLFLAKAWLPAESDEHRRYHSFSSGAENALIHRQTANFASGRGYRNLTATGAGALGLTEQGYLGVNWTFIQADQEQTSKSALRIDDLYYRHDLGKAFYGQVGRMDQRNLASQLGGNFGFSMLPLGRFDGARLGTTQAYVNAATATQGSPVTVLLSADARVDAYRGNELLSTAYLRAGVNEVDTSTFPDGSYLVTLRIYENGVLNRTENTPFTKTGGGAMNKTTQWFMQGGRLVDAATDRPQKEAAFSMQTGVRVALPWDIFMTTGVASLRSAIYNETKLDWNRAFSAGVLSTSTSFFAGNNGARGNSQLLSFNNGVSWSLYRYHMRGTSCEPVEQQMPRDIGCYDALNATVSFPIGKWSTSTGYNYSKTIGRPLFDDPFMEGSPGAIPNTGDRARDNVTRTMQIGLSRSFAWRKAIVGSRFGAFRRAGAGDRPGETGIYAAFTLSGASQPVAASGKSTFSSAGTDVRTNRNAPTQIGYNANQTWMWQNGTYRELGVDLSGYRDEALSAAVRGRVDGRFGNLSATVADNYRRTDDAHNASVTGSYASSFALGRSGLFFGGDSGRGEPSAALAVQVERNDDASDDLAAELSGPGVRAVKLGFGASALLPIEGFQPAQAEVRDAATGNASSTVSVATGSGARDYFLMPGKLVTQKIATKVSYTYVGRALAAGGTPLAGAAILNAALPALDEHGGFVLEVGQKIPDLYLLNQGRILRCGLTVQRQRDVIMFVGETTCAMVAPEALPNELRQQARVKRLTGRSDLAAVQIDYSEGQ
jgi:hypothetical protein